MVVIADLGSSRYDYCSKTMQKWYFVVVICNFVVVWMYFIFKASPIFFHFVKQRLCSFLCVEGLSIPSTDVLNNNNTNNPMVVTTDGEMGLFLGCRLLHGNPVPNRHTSPQDPLRVEELLRTGNSEWGRDEFFPSFYSQNVFFLNS